MLFSSLLTYLPTLASWSIACATLPPHAITRAPARSLPQLCQLEGMDEADKSLKESFALHCGHRFCASCWNLGVGQAVVRTSAGVCEWMQGRCVCGS